MRFLQGRNQLSQTCLFLFTLGFLSIVSNPANAQEREAYQTGVSGQLEMVVHILGEVKKPGEFRVVDTTNLMELISKAEGPTEFSNLSNVTITRSYRELYTNGGNGSNGHSRSLRGQNLLKFDVQEYLDGGKVPPPTLKPGDVVMIRRNNWRKWRNAFTIIRDLSVVASVYFLYVRATKN